MGRTLIPLSPKTLASSSPPEAIYSRPKKKQNTFKQEVFYSHMLFGFRTFRQWKCHVVKRRKKRRLYVYVDCCLVRIAYTKIYYVPWDSFSFFFFFFLLFFWLINGKCKIQEKNCYCRRWPWSFYVPYLQWAKRSLNFGKNVKYTVRNKTLWIFLKKFSEIHVKSQYKKISIAVIFRQIK